MYVSIYILHYTTIPDYYQYINILFGILYSSEHQGPALHPEAQKARKAQRNSSHGTGGS